MAVVYSVIILFDFLVAPVLWSVIQFYGYGDLTLQWNPITLGSGGLFHVAMGAVLGLSAFTRGREKMERVKRDREHSRHDREYREPRKIDGKE